MEWHVLKKSLPPLKVLHKEEGICKDGENLTQVGKLTKAQVNWEKRLCQRMN